MTKIHLIHALSESWPGANLTEKRAHETTCYVLEHHPGTELKDGIVWNPVNGYFRVSVEVELP